MFILLYRHCVRRRLKKTLVCVCLFCNQWVQCDASKEKSREEKQGGSWESLSRSATGMLFRCLEGSKGGGGRTRTGASPFPLSRSGWRSDAVALWFRAKPRGRRSINSAACLCLCRIRKRSDGLQNPSVCWCVFLFPGRKLKGQMMILGCLEKKGGGRQWRGRGDHSEWWARKETHSALH